MILVLRVKRLLDLKRDIARDIERRLGLYMCSSVNGWRAYATTRRRRSRESDRPYSLGKIVDGLLLGLDGRLDLLDRLSKALSGGRSIISTR